MRLNGPMRVKEAGADLAPHHLDFAVSELKALGKDAAPGTFEGYASVFNIVDQGGDVVLPGAFKESIAANARMKRITPMLWQHDRAEPIGIWEDVQEDTKGLKVRGRLLVEDDPLAKRAYAHINAGSIGGLSIGYRTIESRPSPTKPNVYELEKLDLREISLVTLPMLIQARITGVKEMLAEGRMPNAKEFEAFLVKEAGFTVDQAKAMAALAAPMLRVDAAAPGTADQFHIALARRLAGGERNS